MPQLCKNYTLEVTPEQFLNACSPVELQETDLLLNRPEFLKKMNRNYRNSDNSDNSDRWKVLDLSGIHTAYSESNESLAQMFTGNSSEAREIISMIVLKINRSASDIISLMPLYQKLERLRIKSLVSSPQPILGNSGNSDNSEGN